MKTGWRVRPMDADDLAVVLEIHDDRDPARVGSYRHWQYLDNPWRGHAGFGIIAESGDEVAGWVLAMGWPLSLAGRALPAYVGTDLHVAPAYRDSFLAVSLLKALFARYDPLLATTANEVTFRLSVTLGATPYPSGVVRWVRPLRPLRFGLLLAERMAPANRSHSRIPAWEPGVVEVADAGGGWRSGPGLPETAELAGFWDEVKPGYALATDRTAPFIEWRYGPAAPPARLIAMHGPDGGLRGWYGYYQAARGRFVQGRIAMLVDCVTARGDHSAVAAAARDFRRRARAEGAWAAVARALPDSVGAGFAQAGFVRRDQPRNGFFVRGRDPLPDPGGWLLTLADGDAGFM